MILRIAPVLDAKTRAPTGECLVLDSTTRRVVFEGTERQCSNYVALVEASDEDRRQVARALHFSILSC